MGNVTIKEIKKPAPLMLPPADDSDEVPYSLVEIMMNMRMGGGYTVSNQIKALPATIKALPLSKFVVDNPIIPTKEVLSERPSGITQDPSCPNPAHGPTAQLARAERTVCNPEGYL